MALRSDGYLAEVRNGPRHRVEVVTKGDAVRPLDLQGRIATRMKEKILARQNLIYFGELIHTHMFSFKEEDPGARRVLNMGTVERV